MQATQPDVNVKPRGTYSDYLSGAFSDKQFAFELINKKKQGGVMFSKETGKPVEFPLSYPMPLVGTVYFKDATGRIYPRRIRYVVGEQSIYVDEQTPDDKIKKTPVVANFVRGRFYVDGNDSNLLKFMFTSDMNESKEGRDTKKEPIFKLVDKSKQYAKVKEQFKLEFDTVQWCQTADWNTKIYPLAKLIFSNEQLLQSASDIRFDLTVMAKRNPTAFKAMLDDPKTERGIILNAAIDMGIVSINPGMNSIYWTYDPNNIINVAPVGQSPIKDFVAKSFTSQREGAYYQIKNAVKEAEEHSSEVALKEKVDLPPVPDEDINKVLDLAASRGIVEVSSNKVWWKYAGVNYQTRDKIVKAMRDDRGLVEQMREDMTKLP